MFNYQINTLPTGQEQIIRTDENGQVWYIPTDPANSDYQAYLAYVANGNQTPTIQ